MNLQMNHEPILHPGLDINSVTLFCNDSDDSFNICLRLSTSTIFKLILQLYFKTYILY